VHCTCGLWDKHSRWRCHGIAKKQQARGLALSCFQDSCNFSSPQPTSKGFRSCNQGPALLWAVGHLPNTNACSTAHAHRLIWVRGAIGNILYPCSTQEMRCSCIDRRVESIAQRITGLAAFFRQEISLL
jgi:hypothetical protein